MYVITEQQELPRYFSHIYLSILAYLRKIFLCACVRKIKIAVNLVNVLDTRCNKPNWSCYKVLKQMFYV